MPLRDEDAGAFEALLAVYLFRQPGNQAGEDVGDHQQEQLDQDERQYALVDGAGGHRAGGDAAQVEQGEAEWWGEEGGLQVQRDHHAEPDRIQPHGQQYRADNRHHHEGDLDEVEDEAEQEDHQHHQEEGAEYPAWQLGEDVLDHDLAAETAEHQGEQRGANQDQEHHGTDLGGAIGHFTQLAEVQLALVEGQRHGAECPEGGRFGGGGVTGENRAEHCADQQQWRHKGVDQLAPFDRAEFFLRQRRQLLRLEDRHADDVEDIQADQQQAGQQRADEQVADRDGFRREDAHLQLRLLIGAGHHVTQQDQHDRRRNDLSQGAGGRQGAGGDGRVVTAPQHGRQGQQAHGHHGGADDAGTGGEQCTDHAYGNRQAAAQGAEQPRHGFQQVFGDPRFFQHHPHEHRTEER